MYLSIYILCIWTIAASALHTKTVLSDEELASSPVIRHLVERMSVLETRDRNQQRKIDELETRVDSQGKEIIQLRKNEVEKNKMITELVTSVRKRETGKEN